jgi:DNA-directed RNA polymerase beta' subunit
MTAGGAALPAPGCVPSPTSTYSPLRALLPRRSPENLILTHLLVPPVAIRPSVPMDAGGGSNEDDLTVKLQEIISMNTSLRLALSKGASSKMVAENWDFLQVQVRAPCRCAF